MRTGNQRQLSHFWSLTRSSAFVSPSARENSFTSFWTTPPQILEAHHLTGEDCFLLEVVARSMPDLESLAENWSPSDTSRQTSYSAALPTGTRYHPAPEESVPPLEPRAGRPQPEPRHDRSAVNNASRYPDPRR
ncbi:Lrp/AsnC ligand binding domain-containing protein [Nocardia noduli]|uniref:Lrp/AsnC ligand binding domain-containing protein n=1 Tax=Nocardia noduli TaxID=2815722 RepID=UPI0020B3DEE7|nr:Lrp/AsnC ligand binding domain-containing protein [Nocardia noduli]